MNGITWAIQARVCGSMPRGRPMCLPSRRARSIAGGHPVGEFHHPGRILIHDDQTLAAANAYRVYFEPPDGRPVANRGVLDFTCPWSTKCPLRLDPGLCRFALSSHEFCGCTGAFSLEPRYGAGCQAISLFFEGRTRSNAEPEMSPGRCQSNDKNSPLHYTCPTSTTPSTSIGTFSVSRDFA